MNKVVHRKKGASLIVVLMVTAVVSTVVTAMLGMIATSYKARNIESKSLQNMYMSDSELDVVYNIINRTSRAAILKSMEDVADENDEVTQNKKFKQNFLNYLVNGIDSAKPESKIQMCIENGMFPIYSDKGISYEEVFYNDNSEIKVMDAISLGTSTENITGEEQINIRVKSTFTTTDSNHENVKELEADFIVSAPEYKEIQVEKSMDLNLNPVYDGKVITADGDMSATGNLNINGDIWVKGTKGSLNKSDKYSGGITFTDAKVNMDANIYTSNTLTVSNSAEIQVKGDVYSANTYLTDDVHKGVGDSIKLNVNKKNEAEGGKLVTFNDLVLNATNGYVSLQKYFGINDINNSGATIEDGKLDLAENKSSSIIVNNLKSSLSVFEEAYIRGVAYIDVGEEGYKTGESVSVKGNYVAYSDPQGNKSAIMKYYSPLQLIEYLNGKEFGVEEKKDHFINYYSNKQVNTALGINLPQNTYSAGVVVNNSGANKGSTNISENTIEGNVNVEKDNFATNVVAMGDLYELKIKDGSLYTSWLKKGLISSNLGRMVNTQINFNNIKSSKDAKIDEFFGKLILNKDEAKKITISRGQIKIGDTIIKLDNEDMKALIVTNGDVEISSDKGAVNFTGNIITSKNVNMNGKDDSINLKYDEEVTTKIYASNKEYLDTIFTKFSDKVVNVSLLDGLSATLSDYDENEYLRKGQWKIIK